jgi:hypothetical protein
VIETACTVYILALYISSKCFSVHFKMHPITFVMSMCLQITVPMSWNHFQPFQACLLWFILRTTVVKSVNELLCSLTDFDDT